MGDIETSVSDVSAEYSSAKDTSTPGGAALAQAEKNDFSTSEESLRLIAQVAAAAAGAAGCAAVGLGVAAPLCAWVGSKLGGAIFDGIASVCKSLFGSDEAEKEIARRQKFGQAQGIQSEMEFMIGRMSEALGSVDNAIVVLHTNLFPDAPKISVQKARQMLKAAGLNLQPTYVGADLPMDDNFHDRYWERCRSGAAPADGLDVPHFPRVMITQNEKFISSLSTKCSSTEYQAALRKLTDDDVINRYPGIQTAVEQWLAKLQETAKTVSAALINLSSRKDIQDLLKQAKELRASNAALAVNNAALADQLMIRKQYEVTYMKLKREAAAKRVQVELQRSEEFSAALTKSQSTTKTLVWLSVGILAATTAAAVVISRRKR